MHNKLKDYYKEYEEIRNQIQEGKMKMSMLAVDSEKYIKNNLHRLTDEEIAEFRKAISIMVSSVLL